jgi:hypothetical protein
MALSGASMHRPGWPRLLDHAERGRFEVVIAEALDCLSRDQADVAILFKRLNLHGVRIVTMPGHKDTREKRPDHRNPCSVNRLAQRVAMLTQSNLSLPGLPDASRSAMLSG